MRASLMGPTTLRSDDLDFVPAGGWARSVAHLIQVTPHQAMAHPVRPGPRRHTTAQPIYGSLQ